MPSRRSLLRTASLLAVCALALGAIGRQVTAQQPTLQPGTAAIWTLAQGYNFGDPVQVCYTVPIPGQITMYARASRTGPIVTMPDHKCATAVPQIRMPAAATRRRLRMTPGASMP